MSRLTIDMTESQHQTLKVLAALEGKTLKEFALERLFPQDEVKAVQELRTLLQKRQAAAEQGEVPALTASEIAEQVLDTESEM